MGQRAALQSGIGLVMGWATFGYEQAIPLAPASAARTLSVFCLMMSSILGAAASLGTGSTLGFWWGVGVVLAGWRRVAYAWVMRKGQESSLLRGRWSSFLVKTSLEAAAQPFEAISLLWAAIAVAPGLASRPWSKIALREFNVPRRIWAPLWPSLRAYAYCPQAVWPLQWLDAWHHQAPVVLAMVLAPPAVGGHLALALWPVGLLFSVWGEPLHQHFYLRWLELRGQSLAQQRALVVGTCWRALGGASLLAASVAGGAILLSPWLKPAWREAGPLAACLAGLFPGNLLIHLSWHCRLTLGAWRGALLLIAGRSGAQLLWLVPALLNAYPIWLMGGVLVLINSVAAAVLVGQTKRLLAG